MHPVVSVAKLKSAGVHRPADVDASETGRAVEGVEAFLVHREADGVRGLRVRCTASKRPVQAPTARSRAGWASLVAAARAQRRALPDWLGRIVTKSFVEANDDSGTMRSFEGVVMSYDASDPDQQFEILYEDGDREWLPASAVRPLLEDGMVDAGDVAMLHKLAAEFNCG